MPDVVVNVSAYWPMSTPKYPRRWVTR